MKELIKNTIFSQNILINFMIRWKKLHSRRSRFVVKTTASAKKTRDLFKRSHLPMSELYDVPNYMSAINYNTRSMTGHMTVRRESLASNMRSHFVTLSPETSKRATKYIPNILFSTMNDNSSFQYRITPILPPNVYVVRSGCRHNVRASRSSWS